MRDHTETQNNPQDSITCAYCVMEGLLQDVTQILSDEGDLVTTVALGVDEQEFGITAPNDEAGAALARWASVIFDADYAVLRYMAWVNDRPSALRPRDNPDAFEAVIVLLDGRGIAPIGTVHRVIRSEDGEVSTLERIHTCPREFGVELLPPPGERDLETAKTRIYEIFGEKLLDKLLHAAPSKPAA